MEQTKMKKGFTLAEVLITLGVIGIVAAMTIPNLVQSYKKKVVETKLVKFYSMMNNAIKLSEVDNGDITTWYSHKDGNLTDEDGNPIEGTSKNDIWFQKYLAPYLNIQSKTISSDGLSTVYYFSDGTSIAPWHAGIDWHLFLESGDCKQQGVCDFMFNLNPGDHSSDTVWNYVKNNNYFEPYYYGLKKGETVESIADRCKNYDKVYGGEVRGSAWCTMWIKLNGWKIPEDYPFKF